MRVVLDTNVLVSACWTPGGLEAQVADLAITGKITACISPEIMDEYRDVLTRPKLAAVAGRAAQLLDALERTAFACPKATRTRVTASIDEDDNRFLECAEASCAQYVITGNLRHYPAQWGNTYVVNARTFLACLQSL
jgi:putative PIN family toxin of toxin-antitoxin system